jgi:hypothetical protein
MSNQFLKLRRSSVPGKIPTTSSLEYGEIALNTYDGLAFIKKSGSSGEEIVTIGATSGNFTGSLFGTASWAVQALTSSYSLNINGEQYYIAFFDSQNSITGSTIYQSGSFTAIRNATSPVDPTNPDILYVNGDGVDTYNLISAHGNRNSYLQTNVQNFNNSTQASSDVVATADNGTESTNYIDMGINSSGYDISVGIVGGQNDAYLYSTGNDLLIGNATPGKRVVIFNGGLDTIANARVYVHEQGTVGINTPNYNTLFPPALEVQAVSATTTKLINAYGNVDDFLENTIVNANAGTSASADFVAYNDLDPGNQETGYINLGINSTNYVRTVDYPGGAGDGYIFTDSSHLILGPLSQSSDAKVTIFAGDTNEETAAKLILYGNNGHVMTGSLTATEGFTGSLYGTASWALNTLTASFVQNAVSAAYAATASSADNFLVRGGLTGSNALFTGTVTAQRLVVQTITSSVDFVTGSSKFGSLLTDTHQFTGSVSVTGSLTVNGPLNATSSWAANALTASYVPSTAIVGDFSRIATGSVTASVNNVGDLFTLKDASTNYIRVSGSSSGYVNIFSLGNVNISASNNNSIILAALSNNGRVDISSYTHSRILNRNTTTGSFITSFGIVPSNGALAGFAFDSRISGSSTRTVYRLTVKESYPDNFIIKYIDAAGGQRGGHISLYGGDGSGNSGGNVYIAGGSGSSSGNIYLGAEYLDVTSSINVRSNVIIGSSTDAGYKLLVSGSGTSGSLNVDNTLYVSGSRVGIGKSTPSASLDVSGSFIVNTPASSYDFVVTGSVSGSIVRVGTDQQVLQGALYVPKLYVKPNYAQNRAGIHVSSNTAGTVYSAIYSGNGAENQGVNHGIRLQYLQTSNANDQNGTYFTVATDSRYGYFAFNTLTTTGNINSGSNGFASNLYFQNTGTSLTSSGAHVGYKSVVQFATSPILVNSASDFLADTLRSPANGTLTNRYGLHITFTSESITNPWGVYQVSNTVNNHFNGGVYIGTTTTSSLKLEVSGSARITDGLVVTGSSTINNLTGSLFGTASWALNSLTASSAATASLATNALTASSADNFVIRQNLTGSNAVFTGTVTAQTLVVQTITSSVDFVTGSTRFGTQLTDTHQFTGSVSVTGSLSLNNTPVISGTGVSGQVSYWNGTTTQIGSNNLFWDAANGRLRIGDSITTDTFRLLISSTTQNAALFERFAATPTIALRRANGSPVSISPILNNDNIGSISFRGWNGSGFTLSRAAIAAQATENWTISAEGACLDFYTTANGSTSLIQNFRIWQNGNVTIQNGGTFTDAGFKLDVSGSARITNGLVVTGSSTINNLTGSLFGTASWALNALTASYALNAGGSTNTGSFLITASAAGSTITFEKGDGSTFNVTITTGGTVETASYVLSSGVDGPFGMNSILSASHATTASYVLRAVSSSFAATASSADNFLVRQDLTGSNALFSGTITAQRLVVQTITSSVDFVTGSTRFGSLLTDTHQFTGSVSITGSLTVNGPLNATSSWARNALTASYVPSTAIIGDLSRIATGSVTASVGIGSASFQLTSGSSTFLFVSSSGNVGIGTNTPDYKLDVKGTTLLQGNTIVSGSSTYGLIVQKDADSFIRVSSVNNSGNAGIQFQGAGDRGSIYGTAGYDIYIEPNSQFSQSDIIMNSKNGTAMNVGIGLTNPSARLHVSSSALTGSVLFQVDGPTQKNILHVTASGQVGIGYATTGSLYRLDVSGSIRTTDQLYVDSASIDYQQNLSVQTGSWQTIVASPTGSYKAAFFDYVAFSGSIGRAGIVTTFWSASATEFYENYTEDLGGSTAGVVLQTAISSSQIVLQATASSAAWTIRSLVRLL